MTAAFSAFLYAILFLGIVLIVDALVSFVQRGGKGEASVQRRLESMGRVHTGDGDGVSISNVVEGVPGWARYLPFSRQLADTIRKSGVETTLSTAVIVMVVLAAALFAASEALLPFMPVALSAILGLVLGVAPVVLYFRQAVIKRRKKFEEQLPDALDLIVRSLRVGHPLSSAMAVVAREIPAPLGSEFQIAFDQVTYGDEVPQAFIKMTERVSVPDLGYLSTAIQIQYESGGNLAEVLGKLSQVIRDRFRMFRKVRAITAEGRFSAWFLSGFPIVVIFLITLVKPDYYSQTYNFEYFPHLAVFTFVLLLVNVIAMKVLTNIKV